MTKTWCVFTSAGDYHNVGAWSQWPHSRNWELIVAFYGDNETVFAELEQTATIVFRMKGGKFQNLKKLYESQPGLFRQYDYIWVADDDVLIAPADIEKLFRITERFEFWVTQPAFSREGRISHEITVRGETPGEIRIVNFVEVTAPMFLREKLEEFLEVYDGSLGGWGLDWWYCNHLNANGNRRFAVIYPVLALNPWDYQRAGGVREILRLGSDEVRKAKWKDVQARFNMQEYPIRVLSRVSELA